MRAPPSSTTRGGPPLDAARLGRPSAARLLCLALCLAAFASALSEAVFSTATHSLAARLGRAHRAAAERARVAQWRASAWRSSLARAALSRPGLGAASAVLAAGLAAAVRVACAARAEADTQAARLEAVLDGETELAGAVASLHEKVASLQAAAAEAEGRSRFWAARAALAEEALVGCGGRASASGSGGGGEGEAGAGAASTSTPPPLLLLSGVEGDNEEGDDDGASLRPGSVSPSFGDGYRGLLQEGGASPADPGPPSANGPAVLLLASTEKAGAPGARYGRALRVSLDFGPLADLPTTMSGDGAAAHPPPLAAVDEDAAHFPAAAGGSSTKPRPPSAASAVLTPLRGLVRRLSGAGGGGGFGSATKKAQRPSDGGLKTLQPTPGVFVEDKENQ